MPNLSLTGALLVLSGWKKNNLKQGTCTMENLEQQRHAATVFQFNYADTKELTDTESLNIWEVPGTGLTYVLNRNDWQNYSGLVAFVVPDSLVPTDKDEFSFLSKDAKYHKDSSGKGNIDAGIPKYARIKARRIRGYISYGLLAKLPDDCGLVPGSDAFDFLALGWYEPDVAEVSGGKGFGISGDCATAPAGVYYKYDVENYKKWAKDVFIPGEPCLVTIKLNGSNARIVFKDGQIHVGSRGQWKKEMSSAPTMTLEQLTEDMRKRIKTPEEEATLEQRAKEVFDIKVTHFKPQRNPWWSLLDHHPQIVEFCKNNEGYCLYGEMYGHVGKYPYNVPPGQVRFAGFDILSPNGRWLDANIFLEECDKYSIPTAPVVAKNDPFDYDRFIAYANAGDNLLPGSKCVQEGVCVRPMQERRHEKLGRVHLKIVSDAYLCK